MVIKWLNWHIRRSASLHTSSPCVIHLVVPVGRLRCLFTHRCLQLGVSGCCRRGWYVKVWLLLLVVVRFLRWSLVPLRYWHLWHSYRLLAGECGRNRGCCWGCSCELPWWAPFMQVHLAELAQFVCADVWARASVSIIFCNETWPTCSGWGSLSHLLSFYRHRFSNW